MKTVHLATDHAGYALKQIVEQWLIDHQYTVIDHGAFDYNIDDDYPDFMSKAARAISENPKDRAIIFGGSGQGEAIIANRFPGVRAVVYYGDIQSKDGSAENIITLSRLHNNANVLSLGVRFITETDALLAIEQWLATDFSAEERHIRRINKIEEMND
jgi:ribose 5-phosphate isomerase B